MVTKFVIFVLVFLRLFSFGFVASRELHHNFVINTNSNATGIEFPQHPSFNVVSSSGNSGCTHGTTSKNSTNEEDVMVFGDQTRKAVKFHLRHRLAGQNIEAKDSVFESTSRDLGRIQTLHTRIVEKKNQNSISRLEKNSEKESSSFELSGKLMATLESGVSLGSGEYFMDVFVGTPPKHFSLILDTGSDLNWIQCVPCYDCFEQNGPHYDPKDSSSFRNINCHDPKCQLVSSPDPPQPCKSTEKNQTCPYYYWYGDSSNTTGDFALETFSINLTTPSGNSEIKKVENVMFGCGHWNRGLFHGATGLLGLGRGPLSFSSQLQSLYGHSFSYCLVNRNSDSSVSSKLIFGEDKELLKHPNLNFTSLVGGTKENPAETFYYVQIKSVIVGDEVLKIPAETWNMSPEGVGGTIIDSGTTLSYFAEPAYEIIKDAFVNKVKGYRIVQDFPILRPCYNVSGVENLELPSFTIVFGDGAVWNFPVENYFIKLDPEDIVCLAILGTPHSAMSIIGNYQQQNFHILYDTKRSRLGYAPTRCADA
ncbi:aspartyl protease family protein 2-like [Lycium barbarum]|uniref:aspartyl protease family protein 2-like n=1 Tax=Lycium barbarum TaxID=112863 RepID=UPI00293EFDFB|nr:aspartyl protease family protein 2-like [Lycium barbarum]